MKVKAYYLSSCDTCKRILKEVESHALIEKQDLKKTPLTEEQLSKLYQLSGSYEGLFSKIARKYKELDLKNKNLTEQEIKVYLLSDYTFLKRPVFVSDKDIFIGNSKQTVEKLINYLKTNG
jgi:arsenate reductase